jgi:hypothetical protein
MAQVTRPTYPFTRQVGFSQVRGHLPWAASAHLVRYLLADWLPTANPVAWNAPLSAAAADGLPLVAGCSSPVRPRRVWVPTSLPASPSSRRRTRRYLAGTLIVAHALRRAGGSKRMPDPEASAVLAYAPGNRGPPEGWPGALLTCRST